MKTYWTREFRSAGHAPPILALGLVLASYANEDGTGIRVSALTLASMLGGCSERTLKRHLAGLVKGGWIKRAMVDQVESYRLAMPRKSQ
jgi:DNA-binding transcriptional regulator PaaX